MKSQKDWSRRLWLGLAPRIITLGAAVAAGVTAAASDLTISYLASVVTEPVTVNNQPSPWSHPQTIPKFNPAIGTLNSVELRLTGHVRSTPRAENLDPAARTLTVGSTGQITVFNSDYSSAFLGNSPSVTTSYDATAYDGTTDYAGSGGTEGSGFVIDPPLSADGYATIQFQPGSVEFTSFVGTGDTTLGLIGEGVAVATGADTISFQISTEVGADLEVIYNYTPTDAAISGKVWLDINQDGNPQGNEIGMAGVTVTLLDMFEQPVPGVPSQVTDANGNYLFTGVSISESPGFGLFWVTVSQPVGYSQSYDMDDGITLWPALPSSPNAAFLYIVSQQFQKDVNFGYYQPVGSIGDRVWKDVNGDGVQDADEPGYPNLTVTLYASSNLTTPLATQLTDTDGKYLFTDLAGGDYTVVVSGVAATFRQSYDLDDGTPAGGTFASANSASVTIVTGERREDLDFGYQQIDASVGDLVWIDRNSNGQQDNDEPAMPGVQVSLRDAAGTILATTATDASGHYLFTGLPAGHYTVLATPAPGYIETYDYDDQNSPPGGFNSADAASFDLIPGQNRDDIDFGYAGGTLGDRAWDDANANGIQDSGESGLVGAVITITRAETVDLPAAEYTTTTDQNGFYSVGDLELPAGTYVVSVTPPPGYRQTYDLDDGARLTGFTTVLSTVVELAAGQTRTDVDFGFQKLASVGDRVWLDYNGNGAQDSGETGIVGRTVALSQIVNGVESSVDTRTTDANGFYTFTNLLPGTYRLTVLNPPTRHIPTWDFDNQSGAVTTPHTAVFTLAAGEVRYSLDFGYQPLGSIGDTVWLDVNRNGVQDGASEVGISGALITATSPTAGTYTTTTDVNGRYLIDNLPAANYTVVVQLPSGLTVDPTYDLDDGFRLSGFNTPNQASSLLNPGEDNRSFDFGYAARQPVLNSAIGDLVWNDINNNGVRDTGEPSLPAAQVQLQQNGTVLQTTTTGSNGQYLFTGLAAGTYTVVVSGVPGAPSYDLDDGHGPFVSPNRATVTVAANQTRSDVDFGYYQEPALPLLASVGDFVWLDTNANGLQDTGEVGSAGVLVELLSGSAGTTVLTSTNTDANGKYAFRNLNAGSYRIRVTPPANYGFTSRDANANASDTIDSDIETTSGVSTAFSVLTGEQKLTIDAGLISNYADLCVKEAAYSVGTSLCGLISSPGYWKNWKNHYTQAQFQAIIANTPHYKTKTVAQVETILNNNANQYNRHLMSAELNVALNPTFGAGTYTASGAYAGKTVLQVLTIAYNTAAASASTELLNTVLYLGAGGEGLTGSACLVSNLASLTPAGWALSLAGIGSDFIFDPVSGQFSELADGLAKITGFVRSRTNNDNGFAVTINLSGYRTTVPTTPSGSPVLALSASQYVQNGGPINPATWSYYTSFSGTLTGFGGYQGAVLTVTSSGPSFQLGVGANGKNVSWGASGTFNYTRTAQATGVSLASSGAGAVALDLTDCRPGTPAGTASTPVCSLIRSPGYWVNWSNHYTQSQLQAIIAKTAHYSTLTVAQVVTILGNTGDQYHRHLMSAELNAANNPAFLTGVYASGSLAGKTVLQIMTTAYNTATASASTDLVNAVLYLGAGGEPVGSGTSCTNTGSACLVAIPPQ